MAALLKTVTRDYDRVSMHGVRRALLERQAESLGLPLRQVPIPKGATNDEYERATAEVFLRHRGGRGARLPVDGADGRQSRHAGRSAAGLQQWPAPAPGESLRAVRRAGRQARPDFSINSQLGPVKVPFDLFGNNNIIRLCINHSCFVSSVFDAGDSVNVNNERRQRRAALTELALA